MDDTTLPMENWQTDAQRAGWETFCAELPGLMETDAHKWVAYRGKERIAIHEVKRELYQLITDRFIPLTEVVVVRIEPLGPPVDLSRPRRVARG